MGPWSGCLVSITAINNSIKIILGHTVHRTDAEVTACMSNCTSAGIEHSQSVHIREKHQLQVGSSLPAIN